MYELIKRRLALEEGDRHFPYRDSKGIWTIGHGHNMEADPDMMMHFTALQAHGITREEDDALFDMDVSKAHSDLLQHCPWAADLDMPRSSVLLDLTFNMGIHKLLEFPNTLHHFQLRDWPDVANRLRASKWYQDVGPKRADPLIDIILTGTIT